MKFFSKKEKLITHWRHEGQNGHFIFSMYVPSLDFFALFQGTETDLLHCTTSSRAV